MRLGKELTLDDGEDELRLAEPTDTEDINQAYEHTDDCSVDRGVVSLCNTRRVRVSSRSSPRNAVGLFTHICIPKRDQDLRSGDFDGYGDGVCLKARQLLDSSSRWQSSK